MKITTEEHFKIENKKLIEMLGSSLEKTRNLKEYLIDSMEYEKASIYRDLEVKIERAIEDANKD